MNIGNMQGIDTYNNIFRYRLNECDCFEAVDKKLLTDC